MYIRHVRINQHHKVHPRYDKMTYLWSCSAKVPLESKISLANVVYGVDAGLIRHNNALDELYHVVLRWRYVMIYYKIAVVTFEHFVEMTRLMITGRLVEDLIV